MSCSECFKGHSHDGEPTGEVQEMFGRPTYVASPQDDKPIKGIIVIVPDAFGWEFVNNRLLADQYALNGNFLVYLPDFMDGRSAPTWLLVRWHYCGLWQEVLTGIYRTSWAR